MLKLSLNSVISQKYDELNENEKYIAQYILSNTQECQNIPIVELAEKTLTSKSSILRFTKKLGFSGFSEFKYFLKDTISYKNVTEDLFKTMEEDFYQTSKLFKQQSLKEILTVFHEANRIYVYGSGWGQRNALDTFCRSLVPIGKYPILIESEKELELSLSQMNKSDMVIILSLSGNNKPANSILKTIKLIEVPLLSITELSSNRLANIADYNLYFHSTQSTIPIADSYSLLSMFQVMDMLYRAYVSEYN